MKINIVQKFDHLSEWIGDHLGKPVSFAIALASVVLWGICGPFTHYSDTWQLVINTSTTILTFLMMFLLQNTQNRDTDKNHDLLEELQKGQKTMLNVQRKMNERLQALEYQLDKKSKSN